MTKEKIYFPNLNGLRFIAAFLVIIQHIEVFKSILKIENYIGKVPFFNVIGELGVILFFVLSGFLITYLLLKEEHSFKIISIRKFYLRRILRIWPLYFFIIILAFFVLPNLGIFILPGYGKDVIYSDISYKLLLYILFFPNLVLLMYGIVPYASQTWSIGAEEQYYFVWPIILKFFKKHRIILMLLIIFLYLVFTRALLTHYTDFLPFKGIIKKFWSKFPIQCMAIGGIFAILLFQKNKFLKFFQINILFYVSIVLVLFLMLSPIYIPFYNEFYSVLFGVIILNFASNKKIKISLENKVLNYLGNISYGLYMYHSIAIVLAIVICSSVGITSNWILYPLSFMFTIIFAGLSYKYFESFFLKFKNKFSVVLSGS